MENKKSNKIKKLIIIFGFILIIIALLVLFILFTHPENNGIIVNNENPNDVDNNSTIDSNETNDSQNQNNSVFNNMVNENMSNTRKLIKITNMKSYFWLEERLEKYYSSNDLFNNPTTILDKEVVKELEITADNYRKFNDFDGPSFRIDEIYEQDSEYDKKIYVVKHKYGKTKLDVKDSVIWVEKDSKNETFSIYPYEYLKLKNYIDFKEGDTIPINFDKEIEANSENKYEEVNDNAETCMKGLFKRYKFDLLLDENHLYSTLAEDYKNLKYPNINDLKQYINNNKTDLYLDTLSKYKVINYNTYVEYRAICNNKRNYVFHVKNMMDYTILLDNYNIINKETYNAFLPAAQAKYCVDRIIEALNYKDYDFIYSKLNPVQKNNFYKNIDDFKSFITKNSYEKNNYEMEDNYLIISDSVYQFDVKITDATGRDFSYIRLKMTVTLKDDTDFVISIINSN